MSHGPIGLRLPDGEPWAGPWRSVAVTDLVADLLRTPATADRRPAVVAVDGRSASGKSTFAAGLVVAVPHAHLVHTDDVAWWHSFFDWAELMRSGVLEPVHRGAAVEFTPPAWTERGRQGAVVVPADAALVVVEGVGAGRHELADLVDVTIWVGARGPRRRRVHRGADRRRSAPPTRARRSRGPAMSRLGHVILYVSDLEASVRFYRDVAGLPHRFTDAGYAEFGTGDTRLAVYERHRAEWLTGHPVRPGPAGVHEAFADPFVERGDAGR